MYVFNYDSTSAIIPWKCDVFLQVFTSYGFTVIFTGMINSKHISLFVQVQQMTENTTDIYLVGCELNPSLWYKWNGKKSDSAVWQTPLNNRQVKWHKDATNTVDYTNITDRLSTAATTVIKEESCYTKIPNKN